MAFTLEQFVQQISTCGVLSPEDISALQKGLAAGGLPQDPKELAQALIQQGKLTKYQAATVLLGKGRALAMGEYLVLDKLGKGSSGLIVRAKHRRMGRLVALKILSSTAAKSPTTLQRFHREAKVAARLSHPNIVLAYDTSQHEGIHYLVMEMVEGADLADIVNERGPLPIAEAIDCIQQAARGLQYAHDQGVVHRDINPGNLLRDPKGAIKVLDLGLARIDDVAETVESDEERLTESGEIMGTCDYMAPEQATDAHAADHRADIYSLGCTLYYLVTGKTPYSAKGVMQMVMAHRAAPIPSARASRPDVPESLDQVCQKMMAKRLEDRYQSMTEVVAALDACKAGGRLPAAASRPAAAAAATDARREQSTAGGTPARPRSGPAPLEAPAPQPEEPIPERKPPRPKSQVIRRPRKSLSPTVAGLAGGASFGAVVVAIVAVCLFVFRSDEPANPPGDTPVATAEPVGPQPVEVAPAEPQPVTTPTPEHGVAQPPKPEQPPEPKPTTVAWETAWDESNTKARKLLAGQRFGDAIAELRSLADRFDSETQREKVAAAVQGIEAQAQSAYDGVAIQAKELLAEQKFAAARTALQPILELHGVASTSEAARKLLAEIEAAEQAAMPPPAEAVAGTKPTGPAPSPAEPQSPEEIRYGEAMKQLEPLLAAWDFPRVSAALDGLTFDEPALAARLAVRRDEIKRMSVLKAKMIAQVNAAQPRLEKMALLLRGINGELTKADETGLTATLTGGKTEFHPWSELNEKSRQKLLQLVVNRESGDDWLAAGLFAFAFGDVSTAERLLAQARALGQDVNPYLGSLAASAFDQAKRLLKDGKFAEADEVLAKLEENYGTTPWFTAQQSAIEAARTAAKDAVFEAAADKLYAEAAALFKKRELFEIKPLVEKLKADYGTSQAVVDATRTPSFAAMEEAATSLGKRITVRLDGRGDFRSIQAAIDDAPPNSLIEIQDKGPYYGKLEIPQTRPGLMLRGKSGFWPIIASGGPGSPIGDLVTVRAPQTELSRLVIAHVKPSGGAFSLILADSCRLRSVILSGDANAGFGADCQFENVLAGEALSYRFTTPISIKDSMWLCRNKELTLGGAGKVVLENAVLPSVICRSVAELRFCTIPGPLHIREVGSTLRDSILGSVVAEPAGVTIENCNVGSISGDSRLGANCTSDTPQFTDAQSFDMRLTPKSPCRGKASDGGDLGVRYTAEMTELLKLAFQLRQQGIVKF